MPVSVFLLVLGAALLHATWNAIVKGGSNKAFETAINALGGGLGSALILPFVPLPDLQCLWLLALSCCCHLCYYLSMASAYKYADMSLAYPVMRGTAPVLTAIVLALGGISLAPSGWVAIGLLSAGLLSLAWQEKNRSADSMRGIAYSLRTSLIITGYTLADGFGARLSGDSLSYTCWIFFLNIFPINLYMLGKYGKEYVSYLRMRGKIGIFGGLCGLASYGIAIWAMTVAPIALVAALRETSAIFGVMLAVFFLGEKLTLLRAAAILLVAAGAILARMS